MRAPLLSRGLRVVQALIRGAGLRAREGGIPGHERGKGSKSGPEDYPPLSRKNIGESGSTPNFSPRRTRAGVSSQNSRNTHIHIYTHKHTDIYIHEYIYIYIHTLGLWEVKSLDPKCTYPSVKGVEVSGPIWTPSKDP